MKTTAAAPAATTDGQAEDEKLRLNDATQAKGSGTTTRRKPTPPVNPQAQAITLLMSVDDAIYHMSHGGCEPAEVIARQRRWTQYMDEHDLSVQIQKGGRGRLLSLDEFRRTVPESVRERVDAVLRKLEEEIERRPERILALRAKGPAA